MPAPEGWKFGDGRPKGTRNRRQAFARDWAEENLEDILGAARAAALEGDAAAMKIIVGLVCAPAKDRPINLELPKVESVADVPAAALVVGQAALSGKITPLEASNLLDVLERIVKISAASDIENRLAEIEKALKEERELLDGVVAWRNLEAARCSQH
jgi:hypothetical protein